MTRPQTVQVQVRMPAAWRDSLNQIAAREGATAAGIIRRIVANAISQPTANG